MNSMITVNVTEAAADFPALLRRVESGEALTITRSGVEVARVLPPQKFPEPALPRLGFFKGTMEIAEDFDEWPEEEARALGIID